MSHSLQDIEVKHIQEQKAAHPALFKEPTFIDDAGFLARFGINIPKIKHSPKAYVKMHPHDFIVEEIDDVSTLHSIDMEARSKEIHSGMGTWSCTLVKCGITTIEAVKDIAAKLHIPERNISYAGIKDKQAISSQRIVVQNVLVEHIYALKSSAYFLKNIRPFKGTLNQGSLKANKFTLRLRLDRDVNDQFKIVLNEKVKEISQSGYYNFFYLQRFGVPRFLSHVWGMYIIQKKIDSLVESVLFEDAPNELQFFRELRKKASEHKDDYKKVKSIFGKYPIYLGQENALLDAIDDKGNISFEKIKPYAQLWVNAFCSLLWNELLSVHVASGTVPQVLPLPLSNNSSVTALYKPYFQFLGIPRITHNMLTHVPFIILQDKEIETKEYVKNLKYQSYDSCIEISFELSKGSYATCFLSHIVDIVSGTPLAGMNTNFMFELVHPEHQQTVAYFEDVIQSSQVRL